MTIDQSTKAPAETAAPATTRYKVAAGVVIVVALGLIVGTVLAMDALRGYQVVLNFIGAVALGGVALLLLRGRGKGLALGLTWLAAAGVMSEAGDRQAKINDTGALAATNTEYFLPPALWIGMGLLIVAAIAVTVLTKRVRGHA